MSNYPGRCMDRIGSVHTDCERAVRAKAKLLEQHLIGGSNSFPAGGLCKEQRIVGKQTDLTSPASINKMTSSKWERVGANKHLQANKPMHKLCNYKLCTCKYTKCMQLKQTNMLDNAVWELKYDFEFFPCTDNWFFCVKLHVDANARTWMHTICATMQSRRRLRRASSSNDR